MDPLTMITAGWIGKEAGASIASWIIPNKTPWERYQSKIGWIAGAPLPGELSNHEIRSMAMSTAPTGSGLSTTTSAAASAQFPGLVDNRAALEATTDSLYAVNADIRVSHAKQKLSDRIQALSTSADQYSAKGKWKQGLMGIAAERSVDEWEEKDSKVRTIGGIAGASAVGLAIGGDRLLDFLGKRRIWRLMGKISPLVGL